MSSELGLRLTTHPMHLVSEESLLAWQLYRAHFAGGMTPGPLPFAGGYADQPACVIASFDVLAGAESALSIRSKD